jgi:superoxide dismutase, Cu-Zn family
MAAQASFQTACRTVLTCPAGLATAPPVGHGFHVHATGTCDPSIPAGQTSPFTSAGGHFNPTGATHGSHAGDQPVLLVNADGTATARFATDRFGVESLLDADGSAFIVHAAPDNYANIASRYSAAGVPGPDAATLTTGDAGARVFCGVIEG